MGALPLVAILVLDASDWQVSLLAAGAGIVGAAVIVPLGPWVEFHPKLPTMIAADVLRCATLASVPVASWLGVLTYTQLCVVAAAQTVGVILSSAASAAYLKGLVPDDRLARVNSRWETTMWTASSLGPPVGGVLVSALGALAAIIVDAASYLLSALTLGRTRRPEPAPAAPARRRHSLAEMTAGWRHIAAHPVPRALFVHALLFGGCLVASTPLIAVLLLRDLGFSPAQYGLALGVPCLAGVLGSLLAPGVIRRAGLMPTLLAAGAARCLWMGVLPVAPGTAAGLALIIGADTMLLLCAGVFNPAFTTYRMQAAGDGYLARVTAAWAISSKIAQPLMITAAGLAAAALGARTALLVLAGVLLASVVLLPWNAWHPRPGPDTAAMPDVLTDGAATTTATTSSRWTERRPTFHQPPAPAKRTHQQRERGDEQVQRITIVGSGGAGKTLLANRLGDLLDIPVTHLDALRYTPSWQRVPEEDFVARQQEIITRERWIMDGNSLASLPVRAAAADTVIVVDPPPLICLWGILQRRLRYRGGQHPDGAYDRITAEFLRYVVTYRRRHLPRTLACIAEHAKQATVVHLTRRRHADEFLARLAFRHGNR